MFLPMTYPQSMAKSRPVRGATQNQESVRFNLPERDVDGDWLDNRELLDEGPPPLRTTVTVEKPRTIIGRRSMCRSARQSVRRSAGPVTPSPRDMDGDLDGHAVPALVLA